MSRFILIVLGVLIPTLAWSAPSVDDAAEAFRRGEFGTSARMYKDLVKSHPRNADLWFNLGTAYARSELEMGRAVHAFEQSLALQPEAQDTRHNLEEMKRMIRDKALENVDGDRLVLPGDDDTGSGLLASLSKPAIQFIFISTWLATFLVLILLRWREELRTITVLNFSWIVFALVALCAGGVLLARDQVVEEASYGVVIEQTPARRGPGPDYPLESIVSPGVKVTLSGKEEGWRRVSLPGGVDAWIEDVHVPEVLQ